MEEATSKLASVGACVLSHHDLQRASLAAAPTPLVVYSDRIVQLNMYDFTCSYGDPSLCFLSYLAI